jgi:hypothetical protein
MPKPIFDFADPCIVQAWHAIDDRVAGGLSRIRRIGRRMTAAV